MGRAVAQLVEAQLLFRYGARGGAVD
jgi:hypothetical protein